MEDLMAEITKRIEREVAEAKAQSQSTYLDVAACERRLKQAQEAHERAHERLRQATEAQKRAASLAELVAV